MNKKIYLASPHMSDEGYEQEYVKEAFDTNWIAPLGENVNKFEEELASYVGTKYAAALSAGTAAIHMAFKALDVKEGDIVFCSSLTFSATANPITYQNATPVFIDSEPETWNMDPKALEKAFEKYPHPKAVIVVHLYGTPAKIEEIFFLHFTKTFILLTLYTIINTMHRLMPIVKVALCVKKALTAMMIFNINLFSKKKPKNKIGAIPPAFQQRPVGT